MTDAPAENDLHVRLYFASVVLLVFLSILNLAGNLLLLIALRLTVLLQSNVKWLLANTSFAAIVISVHFFVRSTGRLVDFGHFETMPATVCSLQETVFTAAMLILFLSVVVIGVERYLTMTTIRSPFKWIGPSVSALLWVLAFCLCAVLVHLSSDEPPVDYCANLLVANVYVFFLTNALTICSDALGIFFFLRVLCFNTDVIRKLSVNLPTSTLNIRFEINRNVALAKMLLPSVIAHAIVYALVIAGSCLVYVYMDRSSPTAGGRALVNLLYAGMLAHSAAHPLICFRQSASLRKSLRLQLTVRSTGADQRHSSSRTPTTMGGFGEVTAVASPQPPMGNTLLTPPADSNASVFFFSPDPGSEGRRPTVPFEEHEEMLKKVWRVRQRQQGRKTPASVLRANSTLSGSGKRSAGALLVPSPTRGRAGSGSGASRTRTGSDGSKVLFSFEVVDTDAHAAKYSAPLSYTRRHSPTLFEGRCSPTLFEDRQD